MGSCVSSHKKVIASKTMNIPPSPVKESKPTIADVALKTQWSSSQDFGSKDEAFFDSQPWLESDCEDDFFSVKGDFTPSCGSTPVHQVYSKGSPQVNKLLCDIRSSCPDLGTSPTKKKKLAELFRESRGERDFPDLNMILGTQNMGNNSKHAMPPKSSPSTPYVSAANPVCSSERTPNGAFIANRVKPYSSMQCCLPGLASCRTSSERRKMSASVAVNDAPVAM